MRIGRNSGLFVAALLAATIASTGTAHAQTTYAGVRLWDAGPYSVWSGVDASNTSQRILGVIGATKSFEITYSPGSVPNVQYFSDHVELTVPAAKHLTPVGPMQGFILSCHSDGGAIVCDCAASADDNVCDKSGILTGSASTTWYDL